MIKSAAVRYPVDIENIEPGAIHRVITGDCHATIHLKAMEVEDIKYKEGIEGFITDTEEFLTRTAAAEHAFACGQIKEKKDFLFSADIQTI